jgi:hypothetical protein
MGQFFRVLLSPMTFAVGFLWPMATQLLVGLGVVEAGWPAVIIGAAVAMPLGILAQIRGSWIWIK